MIGKPTIKIDYIERLNESEQAGRDAAENAKTYYEKATRLLVKMPDWLVQSTAKHIFRNPPALPVRIEKALPLGAYCLR